MGSKLKLHFYRYEFKYVLNSRLRDEIESEINYFMELDPFVQNSNTKKYFVRSLYFDDPFYSFYFEKIDGLMHRIKFRLRTYSIHRVEDVPVFLEKKGRHNNYVFKHRFLLDDISRKHIKEGKLKNYYSSLFDTMSEETLLSDFQFDRFRKKIEPVMLIDYTRRPYVSKYDYAFRLTFDEKLYGTPTNKLFPKTTVKRKRLIPGKTILEVKFAKHIPAWFHRIIKTYELKRVSISKYCQGMFDCGLVDLN